MHNPLTPDEVALFRALIKSAAIVLLMLRLARPAGARELAGIEFGADRRGAMYVFMRMVIGSCGVRELGS